jgi:hypothetical protein
MESTSKENAEIVASMREIELTGSDFLAVINKIAASSF